MEASSPTQQDLWDHLVRGDWWEPADKPDVPADWIREVVVTGMAGYRPIHAKGVRIRGVTVTGALDFEQATLETTLALYNIVADQPIVLTGATGEGVSITASRLNELSAHQLSLVHSLRLSGTQVAGPVLLSSARVEGDIYLDNGFETEGEVRLLGATIGGNLDCSGGRFHNPQGTSLGADGMEVAGGVFFRDGFEAEGEVRLLGATIGGNLDCSGGRFHNSEWYALSADGIQVTGSVFLRDGFASGAVSLNNARVGGGLFCDSASLEGNGGSALYLRDIWVDGLVTFRDGFTADGGIDVRGGQFGNDLDCSGGTFRAHDGSALLASNIRVRGNVFLNVSAEGAAVLDGSQIDGSLVMVRASFESLSLRSARTGRLVDDRSSWPASGLLELDGFEYGRFGGEAPHDLNTRLEWLRRMPTFAPGPYDELARAYLTEGDRRSARRTAIARETDRRRRGQMSPFAKPWHWVNGWTTGYGFEPWRILGWFSVLLLIGFIAFAEAADNGVIRPTEATAVTASECTPDYPCFDPMLFMFDAFLPVDLEQQDHWRIDESTTFGRLLSKSFWYSALLAAAFALVSRLLRPQSVGVSRDRSRANQRS